MIEMSGADAYFLWEESRARHMHTLKIVVVDPSTAHHPLDFERVRAGALAVLPRFPAFRRRPLFAPLRLGHPCWIDVPALDADYHLRRERLPPGAGREALDALAGQIASLPLDHERPLWQIHFVEGLPNGRVAYVTKLHHALADGSASAEIVLRTFQTGPEPVAIPAGYAGADEAVPSGARLLALALRAGLRRQAALPGVLRRALRALRVSLAWRRARRPLPPPPFAAPATRFNRALTPNRVFAHATLPLSALRDVKQAFGCTLNDVYLSLVGGALRGYLERRGELPARPLTAAVPVSVRRPGDDPAFGNATSYWFAGTGSDVADPVERLRAVAEGTRVARAFFAARDPRLAVDWLEHWPLRWLYQHGMPAAVGALLGRPSFHVIVSNVRGPDRPLYSDGARVEALYSMGPLTQQQGLNFTAWSYLDDFAVGVHACREHVPDVAALAEALARELEPLRREAERRQAGAA
jgi:WS/DGAT/MGAT family acyltransferase